MVSMFRSSDGVQYLLLFQPNLRTGTLFYIHPGVWQELHAWRCSDVAVTLTDKEASHSCSEHTNIISIHVVNGLE